MHEKKKIKQLDFAINSDKRQNAERRKNDRGKSFVNIEISKFLKEILLRLFVKSANINLDKCEK